MMNIVIIDMVKEFYSILSFVLGFIIIGLFKKKHYFLALVLLFIAFLILIVGIFVGESFIFKHLSGLLIGVVVRMGWRNVFEEN
jgi:uncharacterized membrane protein YoaK (UPF0700 family)